MAFTVVHVKWQQWFSKGQFQEQCIWVSFGSNSARVNQKCKRCSKHILLAMLRDEQRLQEIFLNATWGKFSWRLQAIRLSIQNTLMPFFDHEGAVPPCQMVNHHYCWGILQHLRDTILQKHLKLYSNEEWLIHHDTAPVHTAFFRTANFGCRKSGCCSPTLFIRLIWLLMNLSHFQECNCIYEGVASRMPLNFTKNHWPSCLQLQNVSSKVLTAMTNKNTAHIA